MTTSRQTLQLLFDLEEVFLRGDLGSYTKISQAVSNPFITNKRPFDKQMQFDINEHKADWAKLGHNLLRNATKFHSTIITATEDEKHEVAEDTETEPETCTPPPTKANKSTNSGTNLKGARKVVPCIFISTGTFCPVHRMHLQLFELARAKVETYVNEGRNCTYKVIAGYISPTHDNYCKKKLKEMSIDSEHRIAMLRLAIKEGHYDDWLSVSEYHTNQEDDNSMVTIKEEMEYIVQMYKHVLSAEMAHQLIVFYLCGSDLAVKLNFGEYGFGKFGVCIVQRNMDADCVPAEWIDNRFAQPPMVFVENEMNTSSSLLRRHLTGERDQEAIDDISFESVQQYMIEHDILGMADINNNNHIDNNDSDGSDNELNV